MDESLTIEQVRNAIREMDPELDEADEAFGAAVVLASLLQTKPWKPRAISQFTGVPERRVARYLRNLRASGVIARGKLRIGWLDENGGMAFWLDVSVATGVLARAPTALTT